MSPLVRSHIREETYRRQALWTATKQLIQEAISSSSVQSIIGATLIFLFNFKFPQGAPKTNWSARVL